ncbi:3-ketoacyl-CoA thiolase OS=Tsukamurella paurometabola OX=2061 GN=fadI_2 PE=3 SV=1 [Tsukamurella paurometabola]|nr:3-ketoacyl-CoA thiolase [Tsukamurella paurometabola]
MATPSRRRAVIVSGARTPFVRAFGDYVHLDSIALADQAVRGLLDRVPAVADAIEAIVWGGVILPSGAPNIAREIALDLGLGHGVEGHTVTRACASGLQAITTAASAIERGEYDIMIAGGSDSVSNAPVNLPAKLVQTAAPLALGTPSPRDYLGAVLRLAPFTGLLPSRPTISERTTGEVMGESADKMARSTTSAARRRTSSPPGPMRAPQQPSPRAASTTR